MDLALTKLFKQLILPPSGLIILFVCAIFLFKKKKTVAKTFFGLALVSLTLLSLPLVSQGLMNFVEVYPALSAEDLTNHNRQAIIVLGGGSRTSADEYGEETVSHFTLLRLRYAAILHKQTQLPLLTTGGTPKNNTYSESELMSDVLLREYAVAVTWQEKLSRNTAENAEYSADILKRNNIKRIFLVTQAWHLRRAVPIFEKQGFDVIAAPTAFEGRQFEFKADRFIPSAKAFSYSVYALHEILGYIWYSIRY